MDYYGCIGSGGGIGGIWPQCSEIHGSFLHQRRHDWGMGLRVASELSQHSHRTLLYVLDICKHCKVSDDDAPTYITTVWNVLGGSEL